MVFSTKIIMIGLLVVFIAIFAIFFIFDNLIKSQEKCEKDKSLKICKLGSLHIVILMLLLIVGGLVVVVSVTAYIMISSSREQMGGEYDQGS